MSKIKVGLIGGIISLALLSTACETQLPETLEFEELPEIQTGFEINLDESRFNVLKADGTSDFSIIHSADASDRVKHSCNKLQSLIYSSCGISLPITDDINTENGIFVGHTQSDISEKADGLVSGTMDICLMQENGSIAIFAEKDQNIQIAVDYFTHKYVDPIDHTVSMKKGEQFIFEYEYPIKSYKINGVDASEYVISYAKKYKPCATLIQDFFSEKCGIDIPIYEDDDAVYENQINIGNDKIAPVSEIMDGINPFAEKMIVDGTKISFCGGRLVNSTSNINSLIKQYILNEDAGENVEITVETYEDVKINEGILVDDAEILDEIDRKAAERKQNIINSPNIEIPEGKTVYYISNDGSDGNDGKTPETAWQSISRLNGTDTSNSYVLFRRGDMFRGKIQEKNGVTYSAYGEGPKPIINGSRHDFADKSFWKETEYKNVYVCTEKCDNVGNIVFDYSGDIENYTERIGKLIVAGTPDALTYDLQFVSDLDTNELYLYSKDGNPGSRFKSIEICEAGNIFQGGKPNVTVDNLTIMFGGSHGVGVGTVENRKVSNNILCWIGGSILKGYGGGNTTRYGNAVEVYGGCDGYYVYDNWIYQIYDTGITHQYSTNDKPIIMKNIEYRGNMIEYCHWSIEYYNRGHEPESYLENVHVHDNIAMYGCYGWGSVGREGGGALHNSFELVPNVTNYIVEDNIFAYSLGNLLRYNQGGDESIEFRNNTYVQGFGYALGYILGQTQWFDENVVTYLKDMIGEDTATVVMLIDRQPNPQYIATAPEIAETEGTEGPEDLEADSEVDDAVSES